MKESFCANNVIPTQKKLPSFSPRARMVYNKNKSTGWYRWFGASSAPRVRQFFSVFCVVFGIYWPWAYFPHCYMGGDSPRGKFIGKCRVFYFIHIKWTGEECWLHTLAASMPLVRLHAIINEFFSWARIAGNQPGHFWGIEALMENLSTTWSKHDNKILVTDSAPGVLGCGTYSWYPSLRHGIESSRLHRSRTQP